MMMLKCGKTSWNFSFRHIWNTNWSSNCGWNSVGTVFLVLGGILIPGSNNGGNQRLTPFFLLSSQPICDMFTLSYESRKSPPFSLAFCPRRNRSPSVWLKETQKSCREHLPHYQFRTKWLNICLCYLIRSMKQRFILGFIHF